jgi:hypothetical protein
MDGKISQTWNGFGVRFLTAPQRQTSVPKDQIILKTYSRLVERYRHEHDRLKFAVSKGQRDDILSDIHGKIKKLDEYLQQAIRCQLSRSLASKQYIVSRFTISWVTGNMQTECLRCCCLAGHAHVDRHTVHIYGYSSRHLLTLSFACWSCLRLQITAHHWRLFSSSLT